MWMPWCIDGAQVVTVIVELNRIPVNDDISVPKQMYRDLIDEIRIFMLHEFQFVLMIISILRFSSSLFAPSLAIG